MKHLQIRCKCGKDLRATIEYAGRTVRCKDCGERITLPSADHFHPLSDHRVSLAESPTLAENETRLGESTEQVGDHDARTTKYQLRREPPASRVNKSPKTQSVPGFEILDELGRGGMGVVYKARHQKLNRTVALKMILAGSHASLKQQQRFLSEAKAVAKLQHPNIVQLFEIGESDNLPWFALEYVDGGSVENRLHEFNGNVRGACELVVQLAEAMQYAHDNSLIHRDLKPANILLTKDGIPKITDFGLAKELEDEGQTRTGAVMGTPGYMSPEQAAGRTNDVASTSDVYSLGIILYELLTGVLPFKGHSVAETLNQIQSTEAASPRKFNPKLSKDIETICLKCLQKRAGDRYQSAREFADDLNRFLNMEPILARPIGAGGRLVRWVRRKPMAATTCVLLLALLSTINFAKSYSDSISDARQETLDARQETFDARQQTAVAASAKQSAERTARSEQERRRRLAYAATLNDVSEALDTGELSRARSLLDDREACPIELRGFLWKLYHKWANPEVKLDVVDEQHFYNLQYLPDGRLAWNNSTPPDVVGAFVNKTPPRLSVWDKNGNAYVSRILTTLYGIVDYRFLESGTLCTVGLKPPEATEAESFTGKYSVVMQLFDVKTGVSKWSTDIGETVQAPVMPGFHVAQQKPFSRGPDFTYLSLQQSNFLLVPPMTCLEEDDLAIFVSRDSSRAVKAVSLSSGEWQETTRYSTLVFPGYQGIGAFTSDRTHFVYLAAKPARNVISSITTGDFAETYGTYEEWPFHPYQRTLTATRVRDVYTLSDPFQRERRMQSGDYSSRSEGLAIFAMERGSESGTRDQSRILLSGPRPIDGSVKVEIVDGVTGKPMALLRWSGVTESVAIDLDGRTLAWARRTPEAGVAELVEIDLGSVMRMPDKLISPETPPHPFHPSPDGTLLTGVVREKQSPSRESLVVWDASSGDIVNKHRLPSYESRRQMVFTEDGNHIAFLDRLKLDSYGQPEAQSGTLYSFPSLQDSGRLTLRGGVFHEGKRIGYVDYSTDAIRPALPPPAKEKQEPVWPVQGTGNVIMKRQRLLKGGQSSQHVEIVDGNQVVIYSMPVAHSHLQGKKGAWDLLPDQKVLALLAQDKPEVHLVDPISGTLRGKLILPPLNGLWLGMDGSENHAHWFGFSSSEQLLLVTNTNVYSWRID